MFALVLLYSTPITSLHNCSNLNHHHSELTIEESHPHCYLCDLQFQPYTAAEVCILSETVSCFPDCSQNMPVWRELTFSPVLSDRGPPERA